MRVSHPPLTFLTRYRTNFREFLGEANKLYKSLVLYNTVY